VTVVLDANVVVTMATADPRRAAVRERLDRWKREAEDLHVPLLFTYELASALAGLEAAGRLSPAWGDTIWTWVDTLDLLHHPPRDGARLVRIARLLSRRSAYDAAYVDLALQLGALLWTLDGKLARNASSVGLPVRLIV